MLALQRRIGESTYGNHPGRQIAPRLLSNITISVKNYSVFSRYTSICAGERNRVHWINHKDNMELVGSEPACFFTIT